LLLALDNDKSVEFAEDVIFGIKGSVWAWSTATAERSYFDGQIQMIRELSEIK
jgi:hypothetical protein